MITPQQLISLFSAAAVSRLLSAAEQRREILYSERDHRVGGQFGRRLAELPEDRRQAIPTIYRKAFLWGSANFLTPLSHEVFGGSQAVGEVG